MDNNTTQQTKVFVMVCGNQLIGGTSVPNYDDKQPREITYGGMYALDGRGLEDLIRISYLEWSRAWIKKYR